MGPMPERPPATPRGRATGLNPANRFERLRVVPDEPADADSPSVATQYLRDASRTVLSTNDSPDVPFDVSLNPYRGCEAGCSYCYARPTHEYLGFSAGLDFESRILVKEDAPELLRRELARPSWRPRPIGLSGVTDPYQPIEHKLGITRRCLEVLAECRNPVMVVTKNAKVRRDIDLLRELARHDAVSVAVSITTLDAGLVARLEPRTTHPQRRLDAVHELNEAGVPAGVLVAPIIPAITDSEVPAILEAAAAAGARFAGYTVLRLPGAVEELFTAWLEEHFPERRDKVLNRIRAMRHGDLNETRFGARMRGDGIWAEQLRAVFDLHRRRLGLDRRTIRLSAAAFRRPAPPGQLSLFGG